MNVYLFRHGDVANPDGVLYGRLPGFHLEEEGKVTIRASAKSLADKNVHKIYTSPLERATETSKIIGETLGLNDDHIIINDALIETDCRSWEGKPLDDFLSHSDYAVDIETQTSVEPIVDSGQRLLNFLESLPKDQNIILVSHGDPIMGLLVRITSDWDMFRKHYINRGTYVSITSGSHGWKIINYTRNSQTCINSGTQPGRQ